MAAERDYEIVAVVHGRGGYLLLKNAAVKLRPEDGGFSYEANEPAQRIDYVWADPAAAARLRTIDSFCEGEARLSVRARRGFL
jgi:hypothetical protein